MLHSPYLALVFVGIFVTIGSAHPTAVPRAGSTKCQTVDSGYLAAFVGINNGSNQVFDLNSKQELTFGSGKPVQVIFQGCTESTPTSFSNTGRIVVEPASSNKCLTVTNPTSSSGPYYVKAEKCSSDTLPSAAQTWGYGFDVGAVIFFTGSKACGGGAGVRLKSDGTPKLGSRKRVELSCSGVSYESLTLTKTKP